jgi:molybdopterin/thiamine biosynthesis adenylyltransferase/rhodanese-related sulfurtransferase
MNYDLTQDELLRYSRHLMIPEVGLEGQRKLKSASVLIIGSGGLGSPIALYLAAAGVGRIGLVDYDRVESSNLQRQVIHSQQSLGEPKVESAKRRLLDLNPFIQVDVFDTVLNSENARVIGADYQILIDGTDNFPTRYLLNDLAVFTGKPFVYGSVFRFEGQVSVFDARKGPCYRCLFAEPPDPTLVPSCGEAGVFGVMPGIVGTIQATETIKLILEIGETLIGQLLLVDALEANFQKVTLQKDPDCMVCGQNPVIHDLIDYEEFCAAPAVNSPNGGLPPGNLISPQDLAKMIAEGKSPRLVDVRNPVEMAISTFPGAISIPIEKLTDHFDSWKKDEELVFICRTGIRSARAVRLAEAQGFFHARCLRGGINAWAAEIDPKIRQY